MGITLSTRYTLVPLSRASASSALPAGTKYATSAMCTPTRKLPPGSASIDRASSRSLAVGGSMLKILHEWGPHETLIKLFVCTLYLSGPHVWVFSSRLGAFDKVGLAGLPCC